MKHSTEIRNQINFGLQRNRCPVCRKHFTSYKVFDSTYKPSVTKTGDYKKEYTAASLNELMISPLTGFVNKRSLGRNYLRSRAVVESIFTGYSSFKRIVICFICKCGGHKYMLTKYGYHEVIFSKDELFTMLSATPYGTGKQIYRI